MGIYHGWKISLLDVRYPPAWGVSKMRLPPIHEGYLPCMLGIYHLRKIPPMYGGYPPYMGVILILNTPHAWWVSTIQEGYLPTLVDTHHGWCIILDCNCPFI